jgi:hypothetical protein
MSLVWDDASHEEFLSPAMAFISRQRSRTAESVMITEELPEADNPD